eukprot:10632102-Alexandrium_andersonii.AAC.1
MALNADRFVLTVPLALDREVTQVSRSGWPSAATAAGPGCPPEAVPVVAAGEGASGAGTTGPAGQ